MSDGGQDLGASADVGGIDAGAQQNSAVAEQSTAAVDDSGNVNVSNSDVDVANGDGDGRVSLEDYSDFSLPEDVPIDEAALEAVKPVFAELGLNKEQAQKLIDFQANLTRENLQRQAAVMDEWRQQVINDKELGGEQFEQNISIARQAVEQFGSPEFKQLLEQSGLGNNPEVVRFMYNVGKLIQEDNPTGLGNKSEDKKDPVSILYPNG